MAPLDDYSSQLMKAFKKKGGAAGHTISQIMVAMDQVCVFHLTLTQTSPLNINKLFGATVLPLYLFLGLSLTIMFKYALEPYYNHIISFFFFATESKH